MKCAFLSELDRLHVGVLAFLDGKYPGHDDHWIKAIAGVPLTFRYVLRCSCGAELELTMHELYDLEKATH